MYDNSPFILFYGKIISITSSSLHFLGTYHRAVLTEMIAGETVSMALPLVLCLFLLVGWNYL